MLNDFPEKLARARKNAGFTQKEIERALNIKQSAIASYESGRSRPTYENLSSSPIFMTSPATGCSAQSARPRPNGWSARRSARRSAGSIKLDTMTDDEIEMIKSILK